MPKDKRAKKFALRLRMVNRKTVEAAKKDKKAEQLKREREKAALDDPDSNLLEVEHAEKPSSALFFSYNMSLGPPYQVIIDTNFINFAIQNKIDIIEGLMDCLYAKCIPIITDCVMGLLFIFFSSYFISLYIVMSLFSVLFCITQPSWKNWVQSIVLHCALPEILDSSASHAHTKEHTLMIVL